MRTRATKYAVLIVGLLILGVIFITAGTFALDTQSGVSSSSGGFLFDQYGRPISQNTNNSQAASASSGFLFDQYGRPIPKPGVGMPSPSGYGNFESCANARGIYYKGQIYVFSLWYKGAELWNKNNYGIQLRYFKNNSLSGSYGMWGGKSEAEPTPVVVRAPNGTEMLFIFVTGQNGNIYFTRVNGSDWIDDDWVKIKDSETGVYISTAEEGWEVAPVYDSRYHRLYVYYAKDYKDYLYVAVTNDFGNTWQNYPVENSPRVYSAPGAVNFYDDVRHTDTLLAVKDTDKTIRICRMIQDAVLSSEVLPTPSSDNIYGYGRPFLIDVGPNIALMYAAEHGDQTYCSDWYIPHIVVFNKTTQQWGEPYQAVTLPDLGFAQGEYQFHWQPNAAMDTDTNTFYLFYGYELCALYTDQTNNGPFWMFIPIRTPGT